MTDFYKYNRSFQFNFILPQMSIIILLDVKLFDYDQLIHKK